MTYFNLICIAVYVRNYLDALDEQTHAVDRVVTDYLIDPANHTGFAQVLEEKTTSYNASGEPTTQTRIQYTIGDDIISQNKLNWTWNTGTSQWDLATAYDTQYLIYDGHGSTRQLATTGATPSDPPVITESYSYDGYGVLLQNENTFKPVSEGGLGVNPGVTPPQATSLLYTGEQFDTAAQSYYLRARYYNPLNGLFNQMDPYAGNTQDPQSLHKYLYCHANPVNAIDPSGMFYLTDMQFMIVAIIANLLLLSIPIVGSIIVDKMNKEHIKNDERYTRNVNPLGFWIGYVGSFGGSLGIAKGITYQGKIHSYLDFYGVNADFGMIGMGVGLGIGASVAGGLVLVFNANSLKDIAEADYWDPEFNFDLGLVDPWSDAFFAKLAETGIKIRDVKNVSRLLKLERFTECTEEIDALKDIFDAKFQKPTIIVLNYTYGLQLYLGASHNQPVIDNPSFK